MKKRLFALLLALALIGASLPFVSAAYSFYVSYYSETIYAGGVIDLYVYPSEGDPDEYSYQWQYDVAMGDGHWYDVPENDHYSGTKTNHLRMKTSPGAYEDWDKIPFQCVVTKGDIVQYSPDIFMVIYPTDKLAPNMRNWGYGLYEPSITNTTGLSTGDYRSYTANAYAGAKLTISCGNKSIDDKAILRESEVDLTNEIHITENGKTTIAESRTTYIPYTVGSVKVELKQRLTIGGHDLGYFDTKTIHITTAKPTPIATAKAASGCSLLRYPYNESEKLASIPKGASVEILGREGSYYQVYYGGYIGYIGASLLDTSGSPASSLITHVDVTIAPPTAGQTPAFSCNVHTPGCQLYKTDPITWTDASTGKAMRASDRFQEGKRYSVSIWLAVKSGYSFQTNSTGNPSLTGTINSNLPPYIYKAYEQDPREVIELIYTFVAKAPEQTQPPATTQPQSPTTTQPQGHTHSPSAWRTTGAYHYKVCTTCGDMLEQEDHWGGVASCVQTGSCAVCGYSYLETTEDHIPDTSQWTARGEMYHFHKCVLCGAHCDIEDHRWSPTYLYQDGYGHAWICADCKARSEITPHVPGPEATETAPQTCKDCGYIIVPAKNHTHNLTRVEAISAGCTQPGNIEYYTCSGCSDRFLDSAGSARISPDTQVSIPPAGHRISDLWLTDDAYHWRNCATCGEVLEETKMVHEPAGGSCATCGYIGKLPADPTQPCAPTTGPQQTRPQSKKAPLPEWIWIGLVAVAGLILGVTPAIVLSKKKGDMK